MIVIHELKKLLSMPALWGFLALLTVFNLFLAFETVPNRAIKYFNSVSAVTGTRYDEKYSEKLAGVPVKDGELNSEKEMYSTLVSAAESAEDIFDTYDLGAEYARIASAVDSSGKPVSPAVRRLMEKKYAALAPVVAQKAASDESLCVYFGENTPYIHNEVFVLPSQIYTAEAVVVTVLIILFSLGCEAISKTDTLVYTTKIGRSLAGRKLAAGLIASTVFFVLIFGVGYGAVFLMNDFSLVWQQSVSSVNNLASFPSGMQQFIAWGAMTVGEYFLASLGISYLLMLSFFTLGSVAGLLLKNSFAAFGIIAATAALNGAFIFTQELVLTQAWQYLLNMLPVGLIFNRGIWFTHGEAYTLMPCAETVGAAACLLVFIVFLAFAYLRFKKKNLI